MKQVEQLNAQLLAERASHECRVEEVRSAGVLEVEEVRGKYEGEFAALRADMEKMKENHSKVRTHLMADSDKFLRSKIFMFFVDLTRTAKIILLKSQI